MAKLAEQAERYDEMVEYMKNVAQSSATDLSLEEVRANLSLKKCPPPHLVCALTRARRSTLLRAAQPDLGRVQERGGRPARVAAHHRLDRE